MCGMNGYLALLQVDSTECGGTLTLECGYYCNASATIQTSDGFQYTEQGTAFLAIGRVLYHVSTSGFTIYLRA